MTISSDDYALLSQDSYEDRKPNQRVTLGGVAYKVLDHASDPVTGYQGTAYRRIDTGEIVIAHRGTEQVGRDGVLTDGSMVFTGINLQTADAMTFTKKVIEDAKREAEKSDLSLNITVTGHSLGGTLAEITAYEYGLRGETFNAYGAVDLLQGVPEGGSQVIDHVRATDVVSAASRHFGTVRTYAAPEDIDHLHKAGYRDDGGVLALRNPIGAVDLGAHSIDSFVPDSKLLGHSIISPENEARYRAHHGMIDRYRDDVRILRTGLSSTWEVPRALGETAVDGFGAVEHGVQRAAHEIHEKAVEAAHLVEREATRGAHAVEHAVEQGFHATEHAAQALANDASQTWNTLTHPGSWFDTPPTASPRLDHASHPDHALYRQTRDAVHRLDTERHRTPDQHSDNLAAALVVAARRDGLSQIHHVALSDDASLTFAMQDKPQSPLRLTTQVHTAQAVNTPIEQSSLAWQQAALSQQGDPAHAQRPLSSQHESQIQPAPRPMGP